MHSWFWCYPWVVVFGDHQTALAANNLNQIISMGGTPVTYDLNGNLVSDGTHAYTHDAVNRLTSVDGTISYTYDALGRRVSKTVSGTTTRYVYDGPRVIAEYDGAGQFLRKYIYGPGLDEPVMMQVGAARYYYLFDSLGSAIGLTDASGNLVESYRYNAYGQPLQASTVGNPYMFTGRRFDSETGLYYYRNRYYSPQLRRFIEPDPIGFEGGMNLYAYVGNDPVNAVDPYGLLFGFNAGEAYGESAALYYANISSDPCASTAAKAGAWAGGLLASLWTPDTSNETFITLSTAWAAGAWHVAKDGWHIGKLGYHSLGKGILKSNIGKDFTGYANSKLFLHLNIAGRHFILKYGKIIQQIRFWRYLK